MQQPRQQANTWSEDQVELTLSEVRSRLNAARLATSSEHRELLRSQIATRVDEFFALIGMQPQVKH